MGVSVKAAVDVTGTGFVLDTPMDGELQLTRITVRRKIEPQILVIDVCPVVDFIPD
jgi:hypothetical protein